MQVSWMRYSGGCILAVLVCLAMPGRADAKSLRWRSNLTEAARESQRVQKPLLIEFSADWCRYCKKMRRTFDDEQIVRHVDGCFIPVEVDADKNQRLAEAVGADSLPTTVIISPQFKLLKRITGYHTPAQLNRKLGEICQLKHETVESKTGGIPANPVKPVKLSTPKPIFDGYCLVSLLDDQKLRQCNSNHSIVYKDRMICFSSAANKLRFQENPLKYWPAADGLCPVSTAVAKKPVEGKALWGAIYHNRLWFFADKASRTKFAASPSVYASLAE